MKNHWISDEPILVTRQDYRRKIFEAWQKRCVYCGKEATTLDHLIPRTSPESSEGINNLIPACLRCNQNKGDQVMEEWYRSHPEFQSDRLFWILEWQSQPWA